ncbi:hypothetical protein Ahia01_000537300 [Argonauta hians]
MTKKNTIRSWVDENLMCCTLVELMEKIKEEFKINMCVSTVKLVLNRLHYTVKSLLPIPIARNTNCAIENRAGFALEYRNLEAVYGQESFIFIDESGFQVVSRKKRGRS